MHVEKDVMPQNISCILLIFPLNFRSDFPKHIINLIYIGTFTAAGSMQMKPTYLSRQPTSPLLPSAPGSKVKENTKLLKQLKLDPIPQPAEDCK